MVVVVLGFGFGLGVAIERGCVRVLLIQVRCFLGGDLIGGGARGRSRRYEEIEVW